MSYNLLVWWIQSMKYTVHSKPEIGQYLDVVTIGYPKPSKLFFLIFMRDAFTTFKTGNSGGNHTTQIIQKLVNEYCNIIGDQMKGHHSNVAAIELP